MVSVVIPTLNEEASLPRTIAAVGGDESEIVIVDAGSTDRTVEWATARGLKILHSPIQMRAAQMNLGAAETTGEHLLFLHADTVLPPGGIRMIKAALENPRVAGGAFARRFASRSLFLKLTCLAAEARNRAVGWHLGDQAIFARRSVFDVLGGFKLMPRFEDLDFSRRLARKGKLVTLRPPVITSARRFEKEGALARTWRDLRLTIDYCHARNEPY